MKLSLRIPFFLAVLASVATAQVRFARLGTDVGLNFGPSVTVSRSADYNGDGYLDLSVEIFDLSSGRIEVHLSDAYGRFRPSRFIRVGFAIEHVPGDFDRDGDIDIMSPTTSGPKLFLNDGTGIFTDAGSGRFPASATGAFGAVAGDLDNDGDLDLVLSRPNVGLLVLENTGGRFRDVSSRVVNNGSAASLLLHDFDNDRRLDIMSLTQVGRQTFWSIRLADTAGNYGRRTVTIDAQVGFPAVGDVDGDRDSDIFFGAGTFGPRDRFFLATGVSWREDASRLPTPARALTSFAPRFVDLDEDGDLDLVVPKSSVGQLVDRTRIYINDGTGSFRDATTNVLAANVAGKTRVVDVDHDGDLDLQTLRPDVATGRSLVEIDRNLTRQIDAPASIKIGATLAIDLYAKAGFAPAGQQSLPLLGLGSAPRAIPVQTFGVLGLLPTSLVTLPIVTHPQTSGKVTANLPIPNNGGLAGLRLSFQALVLHSPSQPSTWRFSNVIETALTR